MPKYEFDDFKSDQTIYEILMINPHAEAREIKVAYMKLAREYHPDKGGNAEKFKALVRAYEIAKDPELRAEYNRYLASHSPAEAAPRPRKDSPPSRSKSASPEFGTSTRSSASSSSREKYQEEPAAKKPKATTSREGVFKKQWERATQFYFIEAEQAARRYFESVLASTKDRPKFIFYVPQANMAKLSAAINKGLERSSKHTWPVFHYGNARDHHFLTAKTIYPAVMHNIIQAILNDTSTKLKYMGSNTTYDYELNKVGGRSYEGFRRK